MDRTSWKPKIYKATEAVDYKAEESICPQCNSSDTRKMELDLGGTGYVGKDSGIRKYDDYLEQCNNCGKIFTDGSESKASEYDDLFGRYNLAWSTLSLDEKKAILRELQNESGISFNYDSPATDSHMNRLAQKNLIELGDSYDIEKIKSKLGYLLGESKANEEGTSDGAKKGWLTRQRGGSAEEPKTQSSRDKEFYDQSTQNTLDTLNQSKVNGFPFFSYVGQPEKIISDGKGGIILYGMKRNPNSIRRVDVKYDEGRDTYTVSFMSNRNKPKGEYNDVYFDQLSGLIAGNKGLGVESYATEDDYKYDWDQLTSLAQKALSNIGYDKKSWNQEPEDIRKEMEKVAYSEENWKEVANKFYKEELNKGKKNGGESQPAYGYGSATGRMSPIEAWNQGADVYGDMGYDPSLRNPIFTDFRGLKWNELPTDIQEAWKSELGYYTQGEGIVDNIEKQLNKFGVNLDRDPEQVEESKASEDYWADDKLVDKYFVVDPESEYVWCGICGQEFYFDNSSMIYHIPNEHPELTESKATEDYDYEPKLDCLNCDGKGCGDCHGTGIYGESKATEAEDDWVDKYFEFEDWIENGEHYGYLRICKLCGMRHESGKIGEQREHLINNHGFTLNELEGNIPSYEGFNQGLYGYVDAKCKTCGIEFDSISDMDDHYAMNSDHVSNLNDLNSDIPNSD